MNSNESLQFYIRFINERYQDLINNLNNFSNTLTTENKAKKLEAASSLLSRASDLNSAISKNDVPPWLISMIGVLNQYKSEKIRSHDVMKFIIENSHDIKNHKWKFESSSDKAFDFDAIFEHYKSQSRLPELFDQIVSCLQSIHDSGEIDSIGMINALGKLIATLKQSKNGSYFSINSAWSFLVSFLENYMWVELAKLPVLGSAMEALEKTIKETGEEMFKVHRQVQQEMEKTVKSEIKVLDKKPSFDFISYSNKGHQISLPNAETSLLSEEV